MGFLIYQTDKAQVVPSEHIPAAAGTYAPGEALKVASGKLAKVGSALTTTPPYICQAAITVEAGGLVPVIRTPTDAIFETQIGKTSASVAMGSKLQVSADGLGVDNTATGTFEVVHYDGSSAGNVGETVYGRFA